MKLVGAYVNDETYERLAALAAANNRTLAGQCHHLFDRALNGETVATKSGDLSALRQEARKVFDSDNKNATTHS